MAAKASRKPSAQDAGQSAEAKKIAELERQIVKHVDRIRHLEGHLDNAERGRDILERVLARTTILLDDAQHTIKAQALVIADARHAEIERRVAHARDMASDIPF